MLSFTYKDDEMTKPIACIEGTNHILYVIDSKFKTGTMQVQLKGSDKFIPIPDFKRQISYIAGPSGCGKSWYAKLFGQGYKILYPENDIFIASRVTDDPSLRDLDAIPIINEDIDAIDIEKHMQDGALVIFDDCDTINNNNLKKSVHKLQNDILECGRHQNIYEVVVSHLINGNDRKNTRTILNECHTLTFFPKSGATYGINYVLKTYLGLPKDQIKEILSLPSRWVTIGKSAPQYILYEKGAYIL